MAAQRPEFSQTFIGLVAATVVAGIIVTVVQKVFFEANNAGSSPGDYGHRIPSPPPDNETKGVGSSPGDYDHPIPPPPPDNMDSFVAPIGADKVRIAECVQRNSGQYYVGRDYSLEDAKGEFGEVLIKIKKGDQTLRELLRSCSARREN
jgi:hypothetical protein